jgi:hypothetical protein
VVKRAVTAFFVLLLAIFSEVVPPLTLQAPCRLALHPFRVTSSITDKYSVGDNPVRRVSAVENEN